jgi:hypothetical protein
MAVSPRFLVAFSLNNVGQYPEVNALGALALVALGTRGAMLAAGFLLGLAVWQQLLGVYFVVAAAVLILVTPDLRRPRALTDSIAGFFGGSYPMWVWNAANAWATFDLFRRGGKQPADRIAGLPDRLERTLSVSFPKLFGLTDLGVAPELALVLGAVLPALVFVMAWRCRADIGRRRAHSPALVAVVLFVVVLSLFAASKFSHRGAQRPTATDCCWPPDSVRMGADRLPSEMFSVARRPRVSSRIQRRSINPNARPRKPLVSASRARKRFAGATITSTSPED